MGGGGSGGGHGLWWILLSSSVIVTTVTVTTVTVTTVCVCLSNSPELVDDGQTNSVLLANLSGRQAPFRAEFCSF